jgi:hypothetical protein
MWRFEQHARVGVVDKGRDEEIRKQQRAQWSQLLSQLHPHFCRRFLQFALHFRDSYQIERKCMSYGHLRTLMIIQGREAFC